MEVHHVICTYINICIYIYTHGYTYTYTHTYHQSDFNVEVHHVVLLPPTNQPLPVVGVWRFWAFQRLSTRIHPTPNQNNISIFLSVCNVSTIHCDNTDTQKVHTNKDRHRNRHRHRHRHRHRIDTDTDTLAHMQSRTHNLHKGLVRFLVKSCQTSFRTLHPSPFHLRGRSRWKMSRLGAFLRCAAEWRACWAARACDVFKMYL